MSQGRLWGLIAGIALALPATTGAQTPKGPVLPPRVTPGPLPSFATNGPVLALAQQDGRVFVGGSFSHVGPMSGSAVLLDPANGLAGPPFPRVEGRVFTTIPDGAGGVYLGGAFGAVGAVPRLNVAHVLADGTVDRAFRANTDAPVEALVLAGGSLWIGGDYGTVNRVPRRRLAAVDPRTGAVAPPALQPDARVRDLAADGDKVFASGEFRGFDGRSRNGLAAFDGRNGALDPNFDLAFDGVIDTLLVAGQRLYVGGRFTNLGGRSRTNLAAIDTQTGDLDRGFSPATNARVNTLLLSDGRLLAAGEFGEIAGQTHRAIAALDPISGRADAGFDVPINGDVYTLTQIGGRLYAGGNFDRVAGRRIVRLVAMDARTGAVDTGFNPDPDHDVYALTPYRGGLLAAGTFVSMPRIVRPNLAAFDAQTGRPDPSFHPFVASTVRALLPAGDRVYVGGDFTKINGTLQQYVGAINPATGAIAPGFHAHPLGAVTALLADGKRLLIGGAFDAFGPLTRPPGDKKRPFSRPGLAAIDARTGALDRGYPALGSRRFLEGEVRALHADGDRLYVAGGQIADLVRKRRRGKLPKGVKRHYDELVTRRDELFALDRRSGRLVRAFNPRVGETVHALLAPSPGRLLVGGQFTRSYVKRHRSVGKGRKRRRVPVYGQRSNLALFDARGRLQRGFRGQPSGAVHVLASRDGRVLAGGDFDVIGNSLMCGLAVVDPRTGGADRSYFPRPRGSVRALLPLADRLYVGGLLAGFGLGTQDNVGALPLAPTPLPPGVVASAPPKSCDDRVEDFSYSDDY